MGRNVFHIHSLKKQTFSKLCLTPIPVPIPFGNVSMVHERLPPHAKLPPVLHNVTSEVVYCLSGVTLLTLGKKTHTLKKGHVVVIPPKTWHAFSTKKKGSEALSIFYPALRLSKNPDVKIKMNLAKIE
jgi:quercetin dioxygenase-like cupin family protein